MINRFLEIFWLKNNLYVPQFTNNANLNDGGEAAAIEIYGGSLGNLISQYFGDGEWTPNPDKWGKLGSE